VGFILTIKSGAIEGSEFVFEDGGEARIGRTQGNDVVVHDNEASRSHARVFETDEGCFIEDLGSANGTFLNGKELQELSLLYSGDVIGVGSGELIFWNQEANAAPKSASPEGGEESTVIKSVEELEAERQAQSALALAARAPKQPVRQSVAPKPARLAPATRRRGEAAAPESAAERARKQREAQKSFWGRLQYAFLTLNPKKRLVALVGLAATGLVVLAGMFFLFYSGGARSGPTHEPKKLVEGKQPIEDSFGWGPGVTWPNVDSKQFEFHPIAPGKMVAVIRYQAKDISAEEVSIQFNNVSLGFVPADTMDVDTRENEKVVPYQLIHNDETNILVFDNVRNPPGKDTWRIWGIAIEIEPIPSFASMDEARTDIARAMQTAKQSYDARNIAPGNLYRAWKAYRRAWLIEESLETKDIQEYEFILAKYKEIRFELDKLCSKYILEFKTAYNTTSNSDRLMGVLKEILQYFPEPAHRCHRIAKQALDNF